MDKEEARRIVDQLSVTHSDRCWLIGPVEDGDGYQIIEVEDDGCTPTCTRWIEERVLDDGYVIKEIHCSPVETKLRAVKPREEG